MSDHIKATGSPAAVIVTPAPVARAPKRDEVIRELINFFHDEMMRDGMGTCDWIAQGNYDVDAFVAAVADLKAAVEANL